MCMLYAFLYCSQHNVAQYFCQDALQVPYEELPPRNESQAAEGGYESVWCYIGSILVTVCVFQAPSRTRVLPVTTTSCVQIRSSEERPILNENVPGSTTRVFMSNTKEQTSTGMVK